MKQTTQNQKTNFVVFFVALIGWNVIFIMPFMNIAGLSLSYAYVAINLMVLAIGTVLIFRDR